MTTTTLDRNAAKEVLAKTEAGIVGRLLGHPFDALITSRAGLLRKHFEDQELGELFERLMFFDGIDEFADEFLAWVRQQAIPAHMLRRSARFVVSIGRRRLLDVVLVKAFTFFQSGNSPHWLLSAILLRATQITCRRHETPKDNDDRLAELLAEIFGRFHSGEQPDAILNRFQQRDEGTNHGQTI